VLYFCSATLSLFGTYLYSLYETGNSAKDGSLVLAACYIGATIAIIGSCAFIFLKSARLSQDQVRHAHFLLTILAFAELSLYIPLGNVAGWFVAIRFCISGSILLVAVFLMSPQRFTWITYAVSASAIAASYGLLIAVPSVGLPRVFDLAKPPSFMNWLSDHAGENVRTFGIFPDYSVAGKLQDIGTVGPLAPPEFRKFVRLVSSDRVYDEYLHTSHFMLAGPWRFDLDSYQRNQPIFDWIGLKYLVLDRSRFSADQIAFLSSIESLEVSYSDNRVIILGSKNARRKAEFWNNFAVVEDQSEILSALKADPSLILKTLMLEKSGAGGIAYTGAAKAELHALPLGHEASVTEYSMNRVTVALPANIGPGVLVIKDIYLVGWSAWVDGRPAKLIRANGLFRGVEISDPSARKVVFAYRPTTFVTGLLLSLLALLTTFYFLLGKAVPLPDVFSSDLADTRLRRKLEFSVVTVLAFAIIIAMVESYFRISGVVTAVGEGLSNLFPPTF
jgi:hypothetical protein